MHYNNAPDPKGIAVLPAQYKNLIKADKTFSINVTFLIININVRHELVLI